MRRLALLVALGACETLPDLPSQTCGNGVVDPGEDCDPFGAPGVCSAAGTPEPCRFTCDPQDCPSGWSCDHGAHICRHGDGTFVLATTTRLGSDSIAGGDLDGDGIPDLVTWSGDRVQVLYGDGHGGFAQSAVVGTPGRLGAPGLGSLNGAAWSDFVVPTTSGLLLFAGGRARSPSPIVSPIRTGGFTKAVPIQLGALAGASPSEGLFVVSTEEMFVTTPGDAGAPSAVPVPVALFPAPFPTSFDRPDVLVADLDGDGVDEVIVGFSALILLPGAEGGVFVYRIEGSPPRPVPVSTPLAVLGTPAPDGIRLADVDGDGRVDLLVETRDENGASAFLLRNVGAGELAAPVPWSQAFPCGEGPVPMASNPLPLAMGALHVDRANRFPPVELAVGAFGICVKSANGDFEPAVKVTQANFAFFEAAIGDFNHDGSSDVVTAGSDGLTFWLGDGAGHFNRFSVGELGQASELVVGDFDGDFYDDLAFISAPATVSIFYGVAQGAPAAVAVGDFASVDIAAGRFAMPGQTPDAIDDLVVNGFYQGGAQEVSLLFGDSSRRMISPFPYPPGLAPFQECFSCTPARIGEYDATGAPEIAFLAGSIDLGTPGQPVITQSLFLMRARGDTYGFDAPQPVCGSDQVGKILSGKLTGAGPERFVLCMGDGTLATCDPSQPAVVASSVPCVGLQTQWQLADLGGDGGADLMASNGSDVLIADDKSGVLELTSLAPVSLPQAIAALNVDDDPEREIVVAEFPISSVLDRTPSGAYRVLGQFPVDLTQTGFGDVAFVVADLNGDGLDDLVVNAPPLIQTFLQVDHK